MASATTLVFPVRRQPPELVPPAKPTPHELKTLSDIDSQVDLCFQLPLIFFYRKNDLMKGKDPVKVIREAISKALVFYYPFAGRLREIGGGRLAVDCTGEGVMFIEADADVSLNEFGKILYPPFPCFEELLYDVPGSGELLNCPLLLVQVTRLKCGGFIFALRLNHTMSDGTGLRQFLNAVSEISRGTKNPSILPVWKRELLNARDTTHVSCTYHRHNIAPETNGTITPIDDMVDRSFLFSATEISALRCSHVPPHLQNCTVFELLTAYLWRCRTIAISPDPHEEMSIAYIINVRNRFNDPLPIGYYGNAVSPVFAVSTADNLMKAPLEHALELVMRAKSYVTEDYVRFGIEQTRLKRPWRSLTMAQTFIMSDARQLALREVDFGWRDAVYGGPARGHWGPIPSFTSFYLPFKNNNGESGIVVPICLPSKAMKVFVNEIEMMTKRVSGSRLIKSAI